MKKFLSILLAVALVLSLGAVAFADPMITEPAWEGDVLKAETVVYLRSSQGKWEDIWWWDFCKDYFKIDFTVTQTTSPSDYKSIAFMGGSMPDVFYQLFFSNNALVEHGDVNGYLLNLDEYITPELMPNLTKIFEANPTYRDQLRTQTGAIYGLGAFGNSEGAGMSFYINGRWLDELNLELPETLDELEVVLEAFKGYKDGVIAIGGDSGNGPRLLANALGWNNMSANYLTAVCVYGEGDEAYADFIYGNQEMFPIFLDYYKKWYDAGYFSKNLFASQVSGDEETALKAEDKVGISQNTSLALNADEWIHMKWLTSDWNENPQVLRTANALNNASFVLDAELVKEPELLERLIKWGDWHYDYDNYMISHMGPSAEDTDWLLGLESGWTAVYNEETGKYTYEVAEVTNGTYSSVGDYQNKRVQGIISSYVGLAYDMFNDADYPYNPSENKNQIFDNSYPYIEDSFPYIYFLTTEEVELTSGLSTSINTYVTEQLSYFVTGELEINDANLSAYFAQLDALGFQEYKEVYTNYYNTYKANLAAATTAE